MIKCDEMSNAQAWELEVVCKNKKYLNAVVNAVLKYGYINFEVEIVDRLPDNDGKWDACYTVFMWSSWFNNLRPIAKDLAKIEKKLKYDY